MKRSLLVACLLLVGCVAEQPKRRADRLMLERLGHDGSTWWTHELAGHDAWSTDRGEAGLALVTTAGGALRHAVLFNAGWRTGEASVELVDGLGVAPERMTVSLEGLPTKPRAITVTPDGGVLVVADGGRDPDSDVVVARCAPDGALLWSKAHGSPERERGLCCATSSEHAFVGGTTWKSGRERGWVIKIALADGTRPWGWLGHEIEEVSSVVAAGDGGCLAVGTGWSGVCRVATAVRLDGAGRELWRSRFPRVFGSTGWTQVFACADPSGFVAVGSEAPDPDVSIEARDWRTWVVRLDAAGKEQRRTRLSCHGRPVAIASDPDGGLFLLLKGTGEVVRVDGEDRVLWQHPIDAVRGLGITATPDRGCAVLVLRR